MNFQTISATSANSSISELIAAISAADRPLAERAVYNAELQRRMGSLKNIAAQATAQ